MPSVNTNSRSLFQAPIRRFIGRQGASAPLDTFAAAALDLLAETLGPGLPEKPREHARAKVESLAALLGLPVWEHDDGKTTLFSVLKASGPDRTPMPTIIDRLKLTSELLAVGESVDSRRSTLDYNVQQILGRQPVLEYLFLQACLVKGLQAPEAIFRYLTAPDGGWRHVYDYVVARSFWDYKKKKAIALPNSQADDAIIRRLRERPVSLSKPTFLPRMEELVREFVYGANELAIIREVKEKLDIKDEDELPLIQYLKNSKIKITKENALQFVPIALAALRNRGVPLAPDAEDGELETDDYSVESSYYEEETETVEFDHTSVEAAAQLFFVMVWGDELGVFEVIDRIAAQTDPKLKLSVRNRELADDLALYVFDERFRDVETGKVSRRIPRAEREMFYRQVFGTGDAPVTDGMVVNPDFRSLWAVLMTEVKNYIVKVELEAKEGQVSRQKVYQAIEDLQYNLSNYCSGMSKVAAPVMYREMDFVIRRLLRSADVTSQLSRSGSPSFMKVIENVRGVHALNPLRNKGVFGHQILNAIAEANPLMQDDSKAFDAFVQTVEAYIVAESQLRGSAERDAAPDDRESLLPGSIPPGAMPPGANGATAPGQGAQDWNF